jgi:hypothetical protein
MLLIAHRNHNVHLQNCHDHENPRSCSAAAEAKLCTPYEQRAPAEILNAPACRRVLTYRFDIMFP